MAIKSDIDQTIKYKHIVQKTTYANGATIQIKLYQLVKKQMFYNIFLKTSICLHYNAITLHQSEFPTKSYSNSPTMTPIYQKIKLLDFYFVFQVILYKTLPNISKQHITHFIPDLYFYHQLSLCIINKIHLHHYNTQEHQ